MMKSLHLIFIFLLLTGCATIVEGTKQKVTVTTIPTKSTCTLSNEKGKWSIKSTPGAATVARSSHALVVTCRKKGYKAITRHVSPQFNGGMIGNVVFGGIIGAGVDAADDATYSYSPVIKIRLARMK